MLPKEIHTRRARRVWALILLLSPAAYLAGIYLVTMTDPDAQAGLAVDRGQAIESAARYAAARELDVAGWESFSRISAENSRYYYYRLRPGPETELARRLAPPVTVLVLFRSPDRRENLEVRLAPDGRLLGFIRRQASAQGAADPGEPAALARAEEALRARPELAPLPPPPAPTRREDLRQGTIVRTYTWPLKLAALPELDLRLKVALRGGEMTDDVIEATFDPQFAARVLEPGQTSIIVLKVLYALALVSVVLLGIVRFVQRARQKELSYQRIFSLTAGITVIFLSVILLTDLATFDFAANVSNPSPVWVVYITGTVSYIFMGLLLGVAYGSGEGDLREAYPGKLTALDGMLTGRIFSRDVARSAIAGAALGGWSLLLQGLVALLWLRQPTAGPQLSGEPLNFLMGHAPWFAPLSGWVLHAVLVAVVGLLLPLPFLQRRLRSRRAIFAGLALFALIASVGPGVRFRPLAGLLLIGAVRAASLVVPFFKFDLLAALAALATPFVVTFIVYLTSQPSPALQRSGLLAAAVVLGLLALECYFAWRGRALNDQEVRPVYARNLAERLSLQAEAEAAREAQMRLMPLTLPRQASLAIAARCLPAHEVGGDFYDLFALDDERLGILVAEGGGRGLASALSIAYAKGYLMPRLRDETGRDTAPAETMRGLQVRLLSMLDEGRGTGVTFAVVDAAEGTLRYARTGDYPRVMVSRGGAGGHMLTPEERAVRFAAAGGAPEILVTEGHFQLAEGDEVVLLTDGIPRSLAGAGRAPEAEFQRLLGADGARTNEELDRALTKAVDASAKRARSLGLEDDLTAVVVRYQPGPAAEDDNPA